MTVRVSPSHAVDCHAVLRLPVSAVSIWGQLRDFRKYASQDFFHAEIEIEGDTPCAGAKLKLCHRYAGLRTDRVGRILAWREGVGYSFSDLSTRGTRTGFPHIFTYRIEPMGETACHLHIRVRGKWTAHIFPRCITRLWLLWVFTHIVRKIENELLLYQLWRQTCKLRLPVRNA